MKEKSWFEAAADKIARDGVVHTKQLLAAAVILFCYYNSLSIYNKSHDSKSKLRMKYQKAGSGKLDPNRGEMLDTFSDAAPTSLNFKHRRKLPEWSLTTPGNVNKY